jgi:hypothetical protein
MLEQVFSEYLGFPCQFSFHQTFHIHLSGAGTIGKLVVDVKVDLVSHRPSDGIYSFLVGYFSFVCIFFKLRMKRNMARYSVILQHIIEMPSIM